MLKNGQTNFKNLAVITKRSILDVAAALDPPLSVNPKIELFIRRTMCTSKGVKSKELVLSILLYILLY